MSKVRNSNAKRWLSITILFLLSVFYSPISNAQTDGASAQTSVAYPEPESDPSNQKLLPTTFVRSVIFGVGAGTLCGFVSMSHFKTNFRKHMDVGQLFRGMSYGLYGGIILGLYLTYFIKTDTEEAAEEGAEPIEENDPYAGGALSMPGLMARSYLGGHTQYSYYVSNSSAPLFFQWKIRF